ncbi:MAG: AAA family ATPase [Desulfovibrionaceae bacterium]|nr:AAA family ATPase [Desulfovibrionaceae bacterium]
MTSYTACDNNRSPLGLLNFSNIREKNKIYVDKTKLIYRIASQDTPIFFSRPRRFGKSLLVNTISCLFENGLQYFQRLYIEKLWDDKIYQVSHLDFSDIASRNVIDFKSGLCNKIIKIFPIQKNIFNDNPADLLDEILADTQNNSIVLLIDKYDTPLTHHISETYTLKEINNILSEFLCARHEYLL